jgi:transposase
MKEPIVVRSLTESERTTLRAGLRSRNAVTLRRCQLLLASAEGRTPRQLAELLGCSDQTVRNVIGAFTREGGECLQQQSAAPKTRRPELDEAKCEQLRALLHASPRTFTKDRSLWPLNLVAGGCSEQGLTKALGSDGTIREALRRMGVNCKRARDWIPSPDREYPRKKRRAPG